MLDGVSILKLVAESLEVDESDVDMETSTENTEEWDSLGHITILSSLDEITEGKSADLVDLTQASSVKEIVEVLKANGLLV